MIDILHAHQSIGFLAVSFLLAVAAWRRISALFGLAVFYTMASALYPVAPSASSAWAIASVALLMPLILGPSLESVFAALSMTNIILILNCIPVLIFDYGIFNAGSVDCTILALAVPAIFLAGDQMNKIQALVLMPLVGITIFLTQGSTAYFVLAAEIGVYLLLKRSWLALLAAPLVFLALGQYQQGVDFLSSNGRLEHWTLFLNWWKAHASLLTGTGTGTFYWLGPAIQGMKPPLFTFMHNDILQALFEQGALGLLIYAAVFLEAIYRSLSRPWLTASFAGLAVSCLTQYPFRMFLSQVLILLLIRVTYDRAYTGQPKNDSRRESK